MISVSRYGSTRFWAVYVGAELLCVTVYKKGALAVRDALASGIPVLTTISETLAA